MKKIMNVLMLPGLVVALSACGKKEEPLPPVDPPVKENLQDAAVEFKETADRTARGIGQAVKGFGVQIGETFRKAKTDLEE